MAAKDYNICPAMFNVYLAKVSKKEPNLMLDDRRIITDNEIFMLIHWKLENYCIENKTDTLKLTMDGKTIIEIKAKGSLLEEIKNTIKEENDD